MALHPLDPLSPAEIQQAVSLIREHIHAQVSPNARLWFRAVHLKEPKKAELVGVLDLLADAKAASLPDREADVLVGVKSGDSKLSTAWYEYSLTLAPNPRITSTTQIPRGTHVAMEGDASTEAEDALYANPVFRKAIEELRLPEGARVIADSWMYGCDTKQEMPALIQFMVYFTLSPNPNTNHYSFPLPLIPSCYADVEGFPLYDIVYTPIFGGEEVKTIKDLKGRFPWERLGAVEYDPVLREEQGLVVREGLKPYRVIQPEGASFTVKGRVVEWQKWKFHVGFNFREGVVINDVRYDGRNVFHRLSVSDMTVPYGDPRAPYHRQQAFDLGDVGAGTSCNELELGCDCLGEIYYFDYDNVSATGEPVKQKSVVCLHEQDEGILSKHTNYRTSKPTVIRNRVLVVQMIMTVANYEYIIAWKFDLAANVHLETRATGILSTHSILPGEKPGYGTIVNPGVVAPSHQHIFVMRIDPAVDGHRNTIIQEETLPLPFSATNPPSNNPYGVGFKVQQTVWGEEGWGDVAPGRNRVFKIVNPSKINPISGRPVGYKLHPMACQMMLAHPDSIAYQRAQFAQHSIFVTKYNDGELFAAGRYTNQSNGGAEGVMDWVARKQSIVDEDVVLWHSFGMTHHPRVEDFPVMPAEIHTISLKPVDFFTTNPAIDVPASDQGVTKSRLVGGDGVAVEEKKEMNGGGCCAA